MIEKIEEIINEWDPVGLLSYGPEDDYSIEAEKIVDRISSAENTEVNTIAEILSDVFITAFGDDVFMRSIDDCIPVAEKISALYDN